MELCTLADLPLMSAQATLSALTTSCMDLVVSNSPCSDDDVGLQPASLA